jgi:hypothetical protein
MTQCMRFSENRVSVEVEAGGRPAPAGCRSPRPARPGPRRVRDDLAQSRSNRTRSGSVDPGILTHLIRKDGLHAQDLDEMLNQNSGLLGISGISGDMREILTAMKQRNARAKLAFDIYVHRLQGASAQWPRCWEEWRFSFSPRAGREFA